MIYKPVDTVEGERVMVMLTRGPVAVAAPRGADRARAARTTGRGRCRTDGRRQKSVREKNEYCGLSYTSF